MINECANIRCGKPLHYLREGRIFVFDLPDALVAEGSKARRLEHFWLCGSCSQTLAMEKAGDGEVQVVVRKHKLAS